MAKISSNPVGCPALKVTTLHNFNAALNAPEVHRFDLLLLDARLGPYSGIPDEEAGITTLQAIRQRRFIPVVFYTGLPHLVRDLVTPLIQVVEKTEGLPRLLDSLSSIFATRLPARQSRFDPAPGNDTT